MTVSVFPPSKATTDGNLVSVYRDPLRGEEVLLPRVQAGVSYRWLEWGPRCVARALRKRGLSIVPALKESFEGSGLTVARVFLFARSG